MIQFIRLIDSPYALAAIILSISVLAMVDRGTVAETDCLPEAAAGPPVDVREKPVLSILG